MSTANTRLGAGRPSAGKSQTTLTDMADKKEKPKRINFDATPESHMKLKLYATKQGKTITEVLNEYLAQLPD